MTKTIMIDGRNLDLEKGTGVATYARNLSYSLNQLGYRVGVLYGNRPAPGQKALLREIAFFDTNAGDVPKWLQYARDVLNVMYAPFGYRATEVPITGLVIRTSFKSKLPYFDVIWNAPEVFAKAHKASWVLSGLHDVHLPEKPGIAHWTYPMPLRIPGVPNLYTLHDLVPLRLPYTTLDNKRRYMKLVKTIVRKAAHIVTVSEASRQDIIRILGAPESKVTNTYQAVTIPDRYANKPLETVQREVEGTFGLEYKGYFLFFGSIEPKKNIGRLIESYLASGATVPLVIVGAQAWKSERELQLLYEDHIRSLVKVGAETRVKRKIIQLSYAPFPLLVSLIRGAKAVLFPSLYEGFGLPVLEAMLLGTPVLSSNTSSVPEVSGDAALLVDPYDTVEMAKAIRQLDRDSDLRDELSRRGVSQADLFSQARYNDRLADLYGKFA